MIKTYANFGYEGQLVDVEIDLRSGIPACDIIGLADAEVAAGRETVKAAILNSRFKFPDERILVSLSPADVRKNADCLAATALAVVLASESVTSPDVLVMGRLSEDGKFSYCPGIYAACETAKEQGIKYAILPDCAESALIEGMTVRIVHNLAEARIAVDAFNAPTVPEYDIRFEELDDDDDSLDDEKGYGALKEAMLVAACGGHHMLTVCRYDSVETWLMQHFDLLLPELRPDEEKEVYRIRSVDGTLNYTIPVNRPFVTPHPTASIEGMCGGGVNCRPGAISMAHSGALFLRGAEGFRSACLQMLRVPLECGSITLSRAGRATTYPAKFQLLMTAPSCPCGNYGTDNACLCSKEAIDRYWRKFGAPLLDRVPIRVVNSGKDRRFMSLKEMREVIRQAWRAQLDRQGCLNQYLGIDATEKILSAFTKNLPEDFTERARHETAKVARTIADMEGRECVTEDDFIKALSLRGNIPADL